MVKIIAEKRSDGTAGRILGVHMVGPWVTEQLGQGYLAVNWEATVDEVAAFVQPHPTLSELFGETVLSLTGRALHGRQAVEHLEEPGVERALAVQDVPEAGGFGQSSASRVAGVHQERVSADRAPNLRDARASATAAACTRGDDHCRGPAWEGVSAAASR
jgi:hypothetical protein